MLRAEGDVLQLTRDWGRRDAVTLYLSRCQVDTPPDLVDQVWAHVHERRRKIGKVVDFGAGDGRFALRGSYEAYVGYEIDGARCRNAHLPDGATLLQQCAFSTPIADADVCIGNPPYVRNQDLPGGWRQRAAESITQRTGVRVSGLANAWQYFFLLGLASTRVTGLVALVIPYEWVSRPSARALRQFIEANKWEARVYRLTDDTFDRVLTTSSITIIDKRRRTGKWRFFEPDAEGRFLELPSPSGAQDGVVAYTTRSEAQQAKLRAKRGLSPGTQALLTLTEGERVRAGLRAGPDVVPCVTSLRAINSDAITLTSKVFNETFRDRGHKCWLIRTDREPSTRLHRYLAGIPRRQYQTATCLERAEWWHFQMPDTPALLMASGFVGMRPKVVANAIGVRAVGGVYGIYGVPVRRRTSIVRILQTLDLSGCIVPHSHGFKKVEVNQLNTLLPDLMRPASPV